MSQSSEGDVGHPAGENSPGGHQPDASQEGLGTQAVPASREPLSTLDEPHSETDASARPGEIEIPSVDDIAEDSDVSKFMAAHVSEDLRRSALRRLFHTAKFNQCDGLDNYRAVYDSFEPLGDVITADMRHRSERMAAGAAHDPGEGLDAPGPARLRNQASLESSELSGEVSPDALPDSPCPARDTLQLSPNCTDNQPLPFQLGACGHGACGLSGCTRCVDACPEGALVSAGNYVRFDPARCRGTGLCALVCPTANPTSDALAALESVRQRLQRHRDVEGGHPCAIFHDAQLSPLQAEAFSLSAGGGAIVVQVPSVVSISAEVCLAVLAFGASRVVILVIDRIGDVLSQAMEAQAAFASLVLDGLGMVGERVSVIRLSPDDADGGSVDNPTGQSEPLVPPAVFSPAGSKRALFFQALDRFSEYSPRKQSFAPLPAGSPFGEVVIDPDACSLCMACVGVCPSGALRSGGELPELYFLEESCFQCGLCRKACPESAVQLFSRMLFDPAQRNEPRLVCRADPFCCILCGRPFAARPIVAGMIRKLAGHRFYQDESAKRRLQMCGDCRVRDMYAAGALGGQRGNRSPAPAHTAIGR